MHVSAIDMSYTRLNKNKGYIVTQVTIVDEAGSPVSGATVDLLMDLPGGGTASGSADTDDGIATFSLRISNSATGDYTSTVTGVTHATLAYEAGDNIKTSETFTY